MSQRPNFPRSSVSRRLNFDVHDPAPDEQIQEAAEDPQEELPQHLQEARLDNLKNTFVEELKESREQAKLKYNFDFETETPLEGDWEWEKVEDNDNENVGRENVQNNDEFRD